MKKKNWLFNSRSAMASSLSIFSAAVFVCVPLTSAHAFIQGVSAVCTPESGGHKYSYTAAYELTPSLKVRAISYQYPETGRGNASPGGAEAVIDTGWVYSNSSSSGFMPQIALAERYSPETAPGRILAWHMAWDPTGGLRWAGTGVFAAPQSDDCQQSERYF